MTDSLQSQLAYLKVSTDRENNMCEETQKKPLFSWLSAGSFQNEVQ